MDVRDSELAGSQVLAFVRDVRLGSVRLKGNGTVSAVDSMSCAALFTLSAPAAFFQDTCPSAGNSPNAGFGSKKRSRVPAHRWSEQID